MACILFWSILTFFLIQNYVISSGIVISKSMTPTLKVDGYFLANKYIFHFRPPKRGEIIIIRPKTFETEQYVKRIIGMPEEEIKIRQGIIFINNQPLNEPYSTYPARIDFGPKNIPKNTYFVMGDNRPVSMDSRHFGVVPVKKIEGKIDPQKLFAFL